MPKPQCCMAKMMLMLMHIPKVLHNAQNHMRLKGSASNLHHTPSPFYT